MTSLVTSLPHPCPTPWGKGPDSQWAQSVGDSPSAVSRCSQLSAAAPPIHAQHRQDPYGTPNAGASLELQPESLII